jgi:hypothetical protein
MTLGAAELGASNRSFYMPYASLEDLKAGGLGIVNESDLAQALKEGVIKKDVWLEFAKSPDPSFKPPLWNIYSKDEAKRLLTVAYRMFYLRLSYIIKRMTKIGSPSELKKYAKAGAGLVRAALRGGS